ncbi:type II toxin-antitoxin system RelE/ParE family toxin [Bradyrhizobium sp. DN5]
MGGEARHESQSSTLKNDEIGGPSIYNEPLGSGRSDVTAIGRRVVVVRAFVKKTQKTPRAEIELALRRANEIA